jgi:hypothetical protein
MTTQQFKSQYDYLIAVENEILGLTNQQPPSVESNAEQEPHVCLAEFCWPDDSSSWTLMGWQFVDDKWQDIVVHDVSTDEPSLIADILNTGLRDFAALWWKFDDLDPMFRMHYVFGWCVHDQNGHQDPSRKRGAPFAAWMNESMWHRRLFDLLP